MKEVDAAVEDPALVAVAALVVGWVPDGASVGLGTGRAASAFIDALGARVRQGLAVTAVATSEASARRARGLGIRLVELDEGVELELTVDGADEVAPNLDVVKGRGGALVHERIVAAASRRQVILVGDDKLVPALGARGHIPVEIIPLAQGLVTARLKGLGLRPVLRLAAGSAAQPFVTENGNLTIDCALPAPLADGRAARRLEAALRAIPGVVDTGLFLGTAERVLVGYRDGRVDLMYARSRRSAAHALEAASVGCAEHAGASSATATTTTTTIEVPGHLIIVPTAEAVASTAAEQFVAAAGVATRERGRFVVALSGGSTPRALYATLAGPAFASRVDWTRVHVFWGDERCVPPGDPASNYRMARETLLDRVPIPAGQIHRVRGEDTPAMAAAGYERALREIFAPGPESRFDLVLLGMGDNGHTASLFPGLAAVREATRWVVAELVPEVGMWRVTLTPPAINAAAQVMFMVTGREKATMLVRVLAGPPEPDTLPAQAIAPDHGRLIWLLDAAAASQLGGSFAAG